jgi:hypothetical protein
MQKKTLDIRLSNRVAKNSADFASFKPSKRRDRSKTKHNIKALLEVKTINNAEHVCCCFAYTKDGLSKDRVGAVFAVHLRLVS